MTDISAEDAGLLPTSPDELSARAQRSFQLSVVVSGVRCTFTYVLLPFVTPFIGLAPGVGPTVGLAVGTVALAANVVSLRRFWRFGHRWRRPVTVLHVVVIALLLALMVGDVRQLILG